MPGSELPADNIPRAIVQRVESEIDGNTATTTIPVSYTHLDVYKRQMSMST